MIFSFHFTNLSYIFLFIQESQFISYLFLIRFPVSPHRHNRSRSSSMSMCIFHFILMALAVSVVSFRSPHLRERRKSGRDRLLPSCRQELPIGIPRRRVGSVQVAYVPWSWSSDRASVYAIAWIVLLLKWRNNFSGSERSRSSHSPDAPVSKKGRIPKTN